MTTIWKFELWDSLHNYFSVGSQLGVKNVVKTKFVDTTNGQVIASRMESQRNKGIQSLVVQTILFVFETKHTQ